MAKKGIRRDQIKPINSVLYGAAAGYAVCSYFDGCQNRQLTLRLAMGYNIPHRYDQVSNADGRVHTCHRAKVQINHGLRPHGMAD